jgi:hypothetical protein
MLASWHDSTNYTIEAVLTKAGGTYYIDKYFKPKLSIPFDEFTAFLGQLGITIAPPASFTPAGICTLLKAHGPIGVTISVGGPISHEIVVYGIDTDPTSDECAVVYQDPNPGVGAASMMSFAEFDAQFGKMASASVNLFFFR